MAASPLSYLLERMSHNGLLLVPVVVAAVHIEGIVLRGISRTSIDKEYNFEVSNTHTRTHTALLCSASGLDVQWKSSFSTMLCSHL